MSYINVNRSLTDRFYRHKMPKLLVKVEGKDNGIKTVVVNMVEVAKALNRPPTYLIKFFGYELEAEAQFDTENKQYIVNSSHEDAKLQDLLDAFIKRYVLCESCENPKTVLSVPRKKEVVSIICTACGYHGLLDSTHKLTTFILKNQRGQYPTKTPTSSAEKSKRKGKDEKTPEKQQNGDDNGSHSPQHGSDLENGSPEKNLAMKVERMMHRLKVANFEIFAKRMKNLDINTEEKLHFVVDSVFEIAVMATQKRCALCAKMCKVLALIKVPLSGTEGRFVNFGKLILTKCQMEFEQCGRNKFTREEITLSDVEDGLKKKFKRAYEKKQKQVMRRQLGNIRFIGELFKLNMLMEPIIHYVMKMLLTEGNEFALECLCVFLKVVGKELEEKSCKQGVNYMELYFAAMQKIVDNQLTSSRVTCILQNVIDLRKKNWASKKEKKNLKTNVSTSQEDERHNSAQQQVCQNESHSQTKKDEPHGSAQQQVSQNESGSQAKDEPHGSAQQQVCQNESDSQTKKDEPHCSAQQQVSQNESGSQAKKDEPHGSAQQQVGHDEAHRQIKKDGVKDWANIRKTKILKTGLVNDMKKTFLEEKNCDVIIKVKGQEFRAHSLILQSRSIVFKETFKKMAENCNGVIEINDSEPNVFRGFLLFLYCGEVQLSFENVYGLYALSKKHDIEDLRNECVIYMRETLSVESICDVFLATNFPVLKKHKKFEKKLKESAISFAIRNARDVLTSEQWIKFEMQNELLACQIRHSIVLERAKINLK